MIRFACPGCEATYSVPDEKAGKTGKCPKCQAQFVIPTPDPRSAAPPPPAFDPTPPPAVSTDVEVEIAPCPGCQARLMVSTNDLGADVECPYCKAVYRAETAGARAAAETRPRRKPAAEDDDRPSRRKRRDEDDYDRPSSRRDEDEDFDDRPARRRGGRRREVAAAAVSAPAILLIVVGSLGLLMGMANILSTVLDLNQNPFAPPGRGGGANGARKAGEYVGSFLSLIWGTVVVMGGLKMKSLTARGSAMTAAIVSMVPCNPCCVLGLPVGIWALVTLSRDDVKRAFD